jgi:hypothetical protein
VLRFNYGNSDEDQRHAFTFAALYELPFGHGKMFGSNWSGVVNQVLGGWQINPLVSLGSGTPFDINYAGGNRPDYNGQALVVGSNGRAANGNVIWLSLPNGGLANSAFTQINNGQIPTLQRNAFHGPGYQTVDLSLFKEFSIIERLRMQLRAEAYNLLNTPQFVNPQVNAQDTANFGTINGTRLSSERELQFAVRFTF